MHIAFLTHEYPSADPNSEPASRVRGIGSVTAFLAQGVATLPACSATVFVLSTSVERCREVRVTESAQGNVNVIRIELQIPRWMRWKPGVVWSRWHLRRMLTKFHLKRKFDLVETTDAWGWLPFGGIPGVPTLVRMHGAMYFFDEMLGIETGDRLLAGLERRTISHADWAVGVSDFILQGQMRLLRRPYRGGRSVIHNGVDDRLFSPGKPPSGKKIVFTGALHERKGIFELADAANQVLASFTDASFHLYGPDYQSPVAGATTAERLIARVSEPLKSRFHVHAPLPRSETGLVKVLQEAAVCCFPSRLEPFGLTPVEAMACGRPVVYSLEGAGPEVADDGVTALLCNPRDPDDIAEKLSRLLADTDLAADLGRAGRRRVEERFSYRKILRENCELYQSLTRPSQGVSPA